VPEPRRITLLTDFGTADGYVAAMKGVIASGAPDCIIDDARTTSRPGDVGRRMGAGAATGGSTRPAQSTSSSWIRASAGRGARSCARRRDVHLVGSRQRRALARAARGPDASACVAIAAAVASRGPSCSAPSMAGTCSRRWRRTWRAAGPATLGDVVADPVMPAAHRCTTQNGSRGVVVHVDRFGNLITNITARRVRPQSAFGSAVAVREASADIRRCRPGSAARLRGSRGLVEIAVRDGSAAERIWSSRQLDVHVTTRGGRGAGVVVVSVGPERADQTVGRPGQLSSHFLSSADSCFGFGARNRSTM
jgi:S-adenosyl-L-methionine hydrolase (adenosine-forming)